MLAGGENLMENYLRYFADLFRPHRDSDWSPIAVTLVGLIILGIVVIGFAGAAIGGVAGSLTTVLLGGGSLVVGGTLGFLFAIPRGLSEDTHQQASAGGTRSIDYRANTNLEQISDWLTKILVGVGLTQLTQLPAKLRDAAGALSAGSAITIDPAGATTLFLLVLVYFTTTGFLFGYLWSRVFLAAVFHRADERVGAKMTRNIRESVIQAHLYDYENKGFEKAIEECDDYFKDFGRGTNAWIWVYSACAYGQLRRWLEEGLS